MHSKCKSRTCCCIKSLVLHQIHGRHIIFPCNCKKISLFRGNLYQSEHCRSLLCQEEQLACESMSVVGLLTAFAMSEYNSTTIFIAIAANYVSFNLGI